jgi:5-methylcytosine-specific restriction endonuclease McrA
VTLPTLRPRVRQLPQRVRVLTVQELTPRPAGDAWQRTRARIELRDGSRCQKCGLIWLADRDVVDHAVPRWAGGSDKDSNLWLLHAEPCHAEKSADEARMRAAGAYVMPEWVRVRLAAIATPAPVQARGVG